MHVRFLKQCCPREVLRKDQFGDGSNDDGGGDGCDSILKFSWAISLHLESFLLLFELIIFPPSQLFHLFTLDFVFHSDGFSAISGNAWLHVRI